MRGWVKARPPTRMDSPWLAETARTSFRRSRRGPAGEPDVQRHVGADVDADRNPQGAETPAHEPRRDARRGQQRDVDRDEIDHLGPDVDDPEHEALEGD